MLEIETNLLSQSLQSLRFRTGSRHSTKKSGHWFLSFILRGSMFDCICLVQIGLSCLAWLVVLSQDEMEEFDKLLLQIEAQLRVWDFLSAQVLGRLAEVAAEFGLGCFHDWL